MRKLNVIDLFAGCGGLTDGFEQSGFFKTLACVEWDKSCCATLAKRLANKWNYKNGSEVVIRYDIQKTADLLKGFNDPKYGFNLGLNKLIENKVDLLIGGPPCQAYSVAGRIRDKHGMQLDYRNYLFESYIKVLDKFRPEIFIFENVLGLLSAKPGGVSIINRIKKAFSQIGYEIVDDIRGNAVFDVADYGVPQIRKRVILLGLNKNVYKENRQKILIDFYQNILPSFKEQHRKTVKDAIFDLPKFQINKLEIDSNNKVQPHFSESMSILNHYPRYHSKRDIQIFYELALDQSKGNKKFHSVKDIKKLYTEKTGKISNVHKYFVLKWNEPSNTIVAHLYKDGLRHIHPDYKQARSISVREAARLQSFDDDFEFLGSMGDQYKMIGNAVPPLFAKKLACAVHKFKVKYNGV